MAEFDNYTPKKKRRGIDDMPEVASRGSDQMDRRAPRKAGEMKVRPADDNEIEAELHGGRVKFNRKMFKDQKEWDAFKDTIRTQAHERDLREHGVDTEGLKRDPVGDAGAIAEYNKRHGGERAYRLEGPDYTPDDNPNTPDRELAHREAMRVAAEEGEKRVRELEADRYDNDPPRVGTTPMDTASMSSAGPGRFFKRGMESAAKVAVPGIPTDIPVREPGGAIAPIMRERPDAGRRAPEPMIRDQGATVYDMDGNPLPFNPQQNRGIVTPEQTNPDAGSAQWIPGGTPRDIDGGVGGAPTPQPGFPRGIDARTPGQALNDMGQSVGAMVGPPGQAQAPVPGASMPGAQAPVPNPEGGASAGFKMSMPGEAPATKDYSSQLNDAQKRFIEAHQSIAKTNEEMGRLKAEAADREQAGIAQERLRAQQNHEYIQERMQQQIQAVQEASAVLSNPARTPDPERYWQSHSKAMFAVGIGLMAAGKSDVSAMLNHVNTAIERDIQQQKDAINAPRDAAKAKISIANNLFNLFKEKGLDDYEASKASVMMLRNLTIANVSKIEAQASSDLAGANAQVAIADFAQRNAKDMSDMQNHRMTAEAAMIHARAAMLSAGMKDGKHDEIMARQIAGVRERAMSLRRMIDEMKKSISDHGTVPFGDDTYEQRDFDLNQIATEMVKLVDPEGRATVEKIHMDRKALGLEPREFFKRAATDQKILDHLHDVVDSKEAEGYRARNLPLPDDYLNPQTRRGGVGIPTSPVR